jgi:uncharacterized protein (TIGR02246 family)
MMFAVAAVAAPPVVKTEKTTTTTSQGNVKDEEAIKQITVDLTAAWNKHDAKAFAAAFSDDATVVNPMGRSAKGKVEIEKLLADEHSTWAKTTTGTFTVKNVRWLKPDVAWVDVDHALTGVIAPDGKPAPDQTAHVASVIVKNAGKWQIVEARPAFWMTPPAPMKKM